MISSARRARNVIGDLARQIETDTGQALPLPAASAAFSSLAGLTADGLLVLPSLHACEPSLLGRPVHVASALPAAGAGARSVVFGDLEAGYAVRRVRGLGVQRQDELHSDNGQVGLRLFTRLDGRGVNADALRILVDSAT